MFEHTLSDIQYAVEQDDTVGFCIYCGAEHNEVDKDTLYEECLDCGESGLCSGEEIIFLMANGELR